MKSLNIKAVYNTSEATAFIWHCIINVGGGVLSFM